MLILISCNKYHLTSGIKPAIMCLSAIKLCAQHYYVKKEVYQIINHALDYTSESVRETIVKSNLRKKEFDKLIYLMLILHHHPQVSLQICFMQRSCL